MKVIIHAAVFLLFAACGMAHGAHYFYIDGTAHGFYIDGNTNRLEIDGTGDGAGDGAWNITVERNKLSQTGSANIITEFVFTCESDAFASGDQNLRTLLQTTYPYDYNKFMADIAGGVLWFVKYKPGSETPSTASTIKIDDETYLSAGVSGILFDETVTTAAVAQVWPGDIGMRTFITIKELYFSMTTLGDGDTATLRIWILKLN